jgi:dipeptidyl aminopeptidase/acylaminoacyl peptidase
MRVPGALSLHEFSPDSKRVSMAACTREANTASDGTEYLTTGVPWFALGCDVYLVDIKTHTARDLTKGKTDSWLPRWSPDGSYLAFLSRESRTTEARLWVWDVRQDQLRPVGAVNIRMDGWEQIEWTPDSKSVLITVRPQDLSHEEYLDRTTFATRHGRTAAVEAFGVTVYQSMGGAGNQVEPLGGFSLDWTLRDLAEVDIDTGKATTLVRGKRISFFRLTKNGVAVAYSTVRNFETSGSQQLLYDLHAVSLRTGQSVVVVESVRLDLAGAFSLSPDSTRLSYRTG